MSKKNNSSASQELTPVQASTRYQIGLCPVPGCFCRLVPRIGGYVDADGVFHPSGKFYVCAGNQKDWRHYYLSMGGRKSKPRETANCPLPKTESEPYTGTKIIRRKPK